MPPRKSLSPRRLWRPSLSLAIALVGFATAMLVGIAIAKSFTLKVEKNAKVTNMTTHVTKHEAIVISHGFAVYTLTGDSKSHPKCTSALCLNAWPPVTVSSVKKLSKAPGIKGKLKVWHHNGFNQVTLAGHPIYMFSGDSANGAANGEGIVAFGGTWHVWKATAPKSPGTPAGIPNSSTTTTSAWG